MDWNKVYITPSSGATDEDIRDFIEWVCSKAERFGLNAELKRYTKGGSGSSDAVSVNPLEKNNETH